MASAGNNDLNFDLDLLAIISILAVCVCFLLSMAVWIPIGTVSMQQGLGETPLGPSENPPTVFAAMQGSGDVLLTLKDLGPEQKTERNVTVAGVGGKVNWAALSESLRSLRAELPQLKNAVILPNQGSSFDDVMQLMDQFKGANLEVGLSPF